MLGGESQKHQNFKTAVSSSQVFTQGGDEKENGKKSQRCQVKKKTEVTKKYLSFGLDNTVLAKSSKQQENKSSTCKFGNPVISVLNEQCMNEQTMVDEQTLSKKLGQQALGGTATKGLKSVKSHHTLPQSAALGALQTQRQQQQQTLLHTTLQSKFAKKKKSNSNANLLTTSSISKPNDDSKPTGDESTSPIMRQMKQQLFMMTGQKPIGASQNWQHGSSILQLLHQRTQTGTTAAKQTITNATKDTVF